MKQFDIILVLGYFRSAAAFLSIIKYLSPHLKIGLIQAEVDSAVHANTLNAQATFLSLCQEFGAEIVPQGVVVEADLSVFHQFPYPQETVLILSETILSKRRVGLMTLAKAGVDKYDNFLDAFEIKKVYVPSKRFMNYLLAHRQHEQRYADVEVVEVGLPFSRYPVFPRFKADYLIAAPTMFSFYTEHGKHVFLSSVLKLLKQILPSDRVVYKSHNSASWDYFCPKLYYAIAKLVVLLPGGVKALELCLVWSKGFLQKQLARIKTGVLHLLIVRQVVKMNEVTPYSEISLEAFLPGVKKGVIGGLSNTIWGTLYFNLPFYNCVDPSLRRGKSELINKDSSNLLDLNLKFFEVPFCAGDISCGSRGEKIITDNDRQGDLIREVQHDLDSIVKS